MGFVEEGGEEPGGEAAGEDGGEGAPAALFLEEHQEDREDGEGEDGEEEVAGERAKAEAGGTNCSDEDEEAGFEPE